VRLRRLLRLLLLLALALARLATARDHTGGRADLSAAAGVVVRDLADDRTSRSATHRALDALAAGALLLGLRRLGRCSRGCGGSRVESVLCARPVITLRLVGRLLRGVLVLGRVDKESDGRGGRRNGRRRGGGRRGLLRAGRCGSGAEKTCEQDAGGEVRGVHGSNPGPVAVAYGAPDDRRKSIGLWGSPCGQAGRHRSSSSRSLPPLRRLAPTKHAPSPQRRSTWLRTRRRSSGSCASSSRSRTSPRARPTSARTRRSS